MSLSNLLDDLLGSCSLSREDARRLMQGLLEDTTPDVFIAAALTALRVKGVQPDEVAGFVDALEAVAVTFPRTDPKAIDTCGTGGDGKKTFNISTTAALLVASMGVPVIKHGNRSASGVTGSADLIEALAGRLDLDPEASGRQFDRTGFAFLFAPIYHPALKRLAPIRKAMGFATVFNIMGPLLNPAGVKRQVLGVYQPDLIPLMARTLAFRGCEDALVIHGEGGYDEATPVGAVRGMRVRGDNLEPFDIDPKDLSIERCSPEDIAIESGEESLSVTVSIFDGEKSPRRDAVLLNAALALQVAEGSGRMIDGVEAAAEAIDSGKARRFLDTLKTVEVEP